MAKQVIYYKNIEGLRNEGVAFEYTPEQISEIIKCKNDIEYFLKTYVKVIHQERGKVNFQLYDYQKKIIKTYQEKNRIIIMSSRQSGKSITSLGYILHFILFNNHKNVAILANKGMTARKLLGELKNMYKGLPLWLQQGVRTWNKTLIELENDCKVITSGTSKDAIRGESISILYIDETAFIERGIWDEFYSSVYPVISTNKNAKIIFSSTPYGLNHFYKLWKDAINDRNGFTPLKFDWRVVPGRDEKWKEKTVKEIGLKKFRQEYELEFLGSNNTLIEGEKLSAMVYDEPIETRFNGKMRIYEKPEKGHNYILLSDVAEGKEQDSSTIQIFDITEKPFKQVLSYDDNTISEPSFAMVIDNIGRYYNNALVLVENNIGGELLYILNYEYEYPNIFYWEKELGIRTTTRTKNRGCSKLKYLIENDQIIIRDYPTIYQLSVFVKKGNSYRADDGEHDDLVIPLVLFSYLLGDTILREYFIEKNPFAVKKEEIEKELSFAFIYNDGSETLEI